MSNGFSRRGFLKGLGVGAGALIGTRLAGGDFIPTAQAAVNGAAVVILHLVGGFNSLFVSADSFAPAGTFGVAPGNYTLLGNGVAIDNTWNTALSTYAKQHLAVLGVRHGLSGHGSAQFSDWASGSQNAGLILANAIGGTGPVRAAVVGSALLSSVPSAAVNGTAYQRVNDIQGTIEALGGSAAGTRVPNRAISLPTMVAAQTMSKAQLVQNPSALNDVDLSYQGAVDTLSKPPATSQTFAELATAYGLGTSTFVSSMASKFAAAELMVKAGTNVVAMFDFGWDTHTDSTGSTVRTMMSQRILGPMATFINRVVDPAQNAGMNVSLMVIGDFARSLPGSDHQPNLSVAVFGRNVQLGTTGKVDANVGLPSGTPSIPGMWSYLAAACKLPTNPFGANPHGLIL